MTYSSSTVYGYSPPTVPITGEAKVTLGNFSLASNYFVRFSTCDNDKFSLSLYKDKKEIKPHQREIIQGEDICGLDWGSFIKQKKMMKVFFTRPITYTYVTIICKIKSITLLFENDEGERSNYWKKCLREHFYPSTFFLREKVKYNQQYVLIQAGKCNISLTSEKQGDEPARVVRSWHKKMFYNSETSANGSHLTLTLKLTSDTTDTVTLECDRDGLRDGQRVSKQEVIRQIKQALTYFTVGYFFTKHKIYRDTGVEDNQDYEQIYDLNRLDQSNDDNPYVASRLGNEDRSIYDRSGDEIKSTMESIYRKYKDIADAGTEGELSPLKQFTPEETFLLNVGYVIYQISRNAPDDTINLPPEVRVDICMKLYTDKVTGISADWTALASEIGIKQGAVNIIKGMLANEMPIVPGAEIVLRHWQFTYNHARKKTESKTTNGPKLPCTREGLLTALKNIGRYDLIQTIENSPPAARN